MNKKHNHWGPWDELLAGLLSEMDRSQKTLRKMIEEQGVVFWESFFSLIGFWQHFGFCKCGRIPAILNVGNSHSLYCKNCNTCWDVPENCNLLSQSRDEDESAWRKNKEILRKARHIEAKWLYLAPGQYGELMTVNEQQQYVEMMSRRTRKSPSKNL